MKILILTGEIGYGGQERQCFNLFNALNESNSRCKIFVWNTFDIDNDDLIIAKGNFFEKIIQLRSIIKKEKFDVIFCMTYYLNIISYLMSITTKVKPIGSIRNNLHVMRSEMSFLFFIINYIFPKKILSNSKNYNTNFNCLTKKIYYLPNIINFKSTLKRSYNISKDNEIKTLSVSRLFKVKNIDFIIDLVNYIHLKGFKINHCHYGNGPELEHLKNKINDLGLTNIFQIKEATTDIEKSYINSDFLFHSSKFEGMPNVVLEAMFFGVPIISSNCGGLSSIIKNGFNGYILSNFNLESYFQVFNKLVIKKELYTKISINANKTIVNNFSKKTVVDRFKKIINK
tara:strand:- start:1733 stop:2761 length:1029 start_codon:yes stop_codon:yes gene_type:complete